MSIMSIMSIMPTLLLPDDALSIACNPETPAETLNSLCQSHLPLGDDRPIMEAIVQNPNAPPPLLARYLGDFPEAFCANPVAPLLLLETPTFWASVKEDALLRLLTLADVPAPVVAQLAQNPSPAVADAARLHIRFAGELQGPWHEAVREACKAAVKIQSDTRRDTASYAAYRTQLLADWVELGLIPLDFLPWDKLPAPVHRENPTLDPNRLSFLSRRDNPPVLPPDATPAFLHDLVIKRAEYDGNLHLAVALHPNTGPDTLLYLMQWRNKKEGVAVALHPNLTPEIWARFFGGGQYSMSEICHAALVQRPDASRELLSQLAQNARPVVRRLVRQHPNAPADAVSICRQAALSPVKMQVARGDIPVWHILYGMDSHSAPTTAFLRTLVHSPSWITRLGAALLFSRPLQQAKNISSAENKPRPLAQNLHLLLQADGNRLVRAVASAKVTPGFEFTL